MILLDKKRIDRTLIRMAYQLLEESKNSPVIMVGINSRGFAVADQIKNYLENIRGNPVPLYQVESNDDTLFQFPEKPNEKDILVIVDDVIFSGGTMFNSILKISELSIFNKVILSVLVDRGHRKYPLLAGNVGLHVPTKLNEHVEMMLENNQPKSVVLLKE